MPLQFPEITDQSESKNEKNKINKYEHEMPNITAHCPFDIFVFHTYPNINNDCSRLPVLAVVKMLRITSFHSSTFRMGFHQCRAHLHKPNKNTGGGKNMGAKDICMLIIQSPIHEFSLHQLK